MGDVDGVGTETQQESSPVKGGDTSGLDDETVIPEKSTASPDTSPTDNPKVLVLPRKGYSKNGKRLGRPPRKKLEEKEKVVDEKPVEEPQKAANSEPVEEIPEKIVPTAVATTKTSPPVVSTEEVSQDVIDELKYGKEYEYDLLYLVNNSYARSRCRLREEAGVKPVGVIIPYKVQNLRYEIVVYYTDEHVIIPIATAKKYAESKLLPYKKASWRIKNQSDDMHIRPALSVINEIFKRINSTI